MERRTWAKLIVSLLLLAAVAIGIYLRWSPIGRSSDPLAGWGRGNPTLSEGAYYSSRINRIVENWGQTRLHAAFGRDGRFKESYKTLLVIDLDKQALWIEDNGQVRENDRAEFPAGMKWKFFHATPQGNKELSGRVVLKMRGFNSSQHTPEVFQLVGTGRGAGHFDFQFHSNGGRGVYNPGQLRPLSYRSKSSKKIDNPYGSLLVADSEYAQQLTDDKVDKAQTNVAIEENKANWLRVEKSLYGEIERHLRSAGLELRRLTVEPGPDFSAAHAEIRGSNNSVLRGFFGGYSPSETYLKIDYLGNDIWYAKSARHPHRPIMPRRTLDLEFLVCPTSEITDSQRTDMLARGRKIQQPRPAAGSKWNAALPNGATVEFIGICENPSAGKQWWGPDGSPLDDVPYINNESYRLGRSREDRKLYEFAWRIEMPDGTGAIRYSIEGSKGSYGRQVRDRYGNRIIEGLSAQGYGFDKSRQKTTLTIGLATEDWQTALVIEDETGEAEFLDKQRIILNPPVFENGQIVVRCFEEFGLRVRDYQTDFGLTIREDSASKTISLDRYDEDVKNNKETGLTEHKFTLRDVSMSQIEGACFRYRPFEFVIFKNISLIPGKNPGFEIQVQQQTENE